MADFPLFIKMDGRKVMVIGGGSVALRKIRILTDYGADIRIISREVRDELKMLAEAGRLEWQKENLTKKHLSELDEAFLVICASNDETVNAMAADYCQKRHILVDCAKPGENSDCVFPSVVRRGNVVIGISTSGGVPALTRHLREKIEAVMPEWYGDFERALRDKRRQLKQSDLSQAERRQSLRQWIAEEEKIREKGREPYENRNKKEPSGYGTDGDGSKGH
ncbi:MAG: bifunctional precorrin-2 dehydrogenase/sirohydrochlorin ferrochelatase [Coprococcus sp.]